MEKDFRQIQLGVESIIGTKAVVRRKRRSTSDKKREMFYNVITSLEEMIVRQNILYADIDVDFSSYDEKFFTIIDSLIYMNFGKQCAEVIAFYLYDRLNPDGTMNPLIINEKEELMLNNPYELWNLLCQVNPKLDE
jgi:hypothetical protein